MCLSTLSSNQCSSRSSASANRRIRLAREFLHRVVVLGPGFAQARNSLRPDVGRKNALAQRRRVIGIGRIDRYPVDREQLAIIGRGDAVVAAIGDRVGLDRVVAAIDVWIGSTEAALFRIGQIEESAAGRLGPPNELVGNAVAGDDEKTDRAASFADFMRDAPLFTLRPGEVATDIDDRNRAPVLAGASETSDIVTSPPFG